MKSVYAGMDIGAVSVKVVVCDDDGVVLYRTYERHASEVYKVSSRIRDAVFREFKDCVISFVLTGMHGKDLSEAWGVPFVSEFSALKLFLRVKAPDVSVVVEMGGESSKMSYISGRIDQRENRDCAGGTGSFLDHLSGLLKTDTMGLNRLALSGCQVYPIAARCGVYAKTDVQGLLNEGVSKADLARSIFHAIVSQLITELGRGGFPKGRVLVLGGPFSFLPYLRSCFFDAFHVESERQVVVPDGELYLAFGAAMEARRFPGMVGACDQEGERPILTKGPGNPPVNGVRRKAVEVLPPLFDSREAYEIFRKRHSGHAVAEGDLATAEGGLWFGIDAGSTTIKSVLIDEKGAILYSYYRRNEGDVLESGIALMKELYKKLPKSCHIAGVGVTGYGEGLLKEAFRIDMGEVETMAHLKAARFFCPEVTALLDIGGQDMKFSQLTDGHITRISLNSACASGCGSFLESFAGNMGMTIEEFTKAALSATTMPDLGAHCTVIMDTTVKNIQSKGIATDALAAGLCFSVVKNALTRVLQLDSYDELGDYVVVEGGTFYNDAVLRAFEILTGKDVIRPNISGLMGAYGMALWAKEKFDKSHRSTLIGEKEVESFHAETSMKRCGGCANHCLMTIKTFFNGGQFITGNRCEVGEALVTGMRKKEKIPDMLLWVKEHVFHTFPVKGKSRGVVGIPAVLDMWTDFPFWAAFWSTLGYRVQVSFFEQKGLSETAITIPKRVYCYACALAHGHVWTLLQRKPDLIWMPAHHRKGSRMYTDEARHAFYGRVIHYFMREEIKAANVSFACPTLPEFTDDKLSQVCKEIFPQISKEEIGNAVRAGREALISYEKEYLEETKKTLMWMKERRSTGILLGARSYQADVQINKGISHIITALGVPVVTAEGIALLNEADFGRGGARTMEDRLHCVNRFIQNHRELELVVMRSLGCGLPSECIIESKSMLHDIGKFYTEISLDQGVNAGAMKIRLRTLLAEMEEEKCKSSKSNGNSEK